MIVRFGVREEACRVDEWRVRKWRLSSPLATNYRSTNVGPRTISGWLIL